MFQTSNKRKTQNVNNLCLEEKLHRVLWCPGSVYYFVYMHMTLKWIQVNYKSSCSDLPSPWAPVALPLESPGCGSPERSPPLPGKCCGWGDHDARLISARIECTAECGWWSTVGGGWEGEDRMHQRPASILIQWWRSHIILMLWCWGSFK